MTATTAKNRVIESIGGASAGYYFRPELFAASLSGEQHPPTPPRPTTGHRGSFCFDCAGNGIRNTNLTTQPELVRAGRSVVDARYVNPISLHGSDYGGHTPEGVEKKIVAGEDIVADIKRICRLR